jgi:hypothetical protein
MKRRAIQLFLFLLLSAGLKAQTTESAIWTTVGLNKDFGKWDFSTEAEIRTPTGFEQINRSSLQVEASYNIFKKLKVGASYQFMYYYDEKYSDYQPRNRAALFVQGKQKWGDFTFSLRERVQVTTKDESDRIKKSGKIDTYKINPAWMWRNRLKVAYNIPHIKLEPSLSVESFYELNDPDGNDFCNMRYTLSLSYNFNKHHSIELYGLMDREMNVNNATNSNVTGIAYSFSF